MASPRWSPAISYIWSVPVSQSLRASRDGDRYHYYWAARRALHLLDVSGDFTCISIEGAPSVTAHEEVIDVCELYGANDIIGARLVKYVQLKHSTVRTEKLIIASELRTTLSRFAEIYRGSVSDDGSRNCEFLVVTNRRITEKVRETLADMAAGRDARHSREHQTLMRYLAFDDLEQQVDFCRRLTLEDRTPGLRVFSHQVADELGDRLPGGRYQSDLPQLVDAVASRATNDSYTHVITRADILALFDLTDEDLFPAPSRIESPPKPVVTLGIVQVAECLKTSGQRTLVLKATGGSGKSALTKLIHGELPFGSIVLTYDCFGGGDYQQLGSARHRHSQAFTQIIHELAALSLCSPVIPAVRPDEQYMRLLKRRVFDASAQIATSNPEALLVLLIDAADNAALAAQTFSSRTFPGDLLAEDWPANVRVVCLVRPERVEVLGIPSGTHEMELAGFTSEETGQFIRASLPDASEDDLSEIHVMSAGNPRVQAMAMDGAEGISIVLARLSIASNSGTSPAGALDELLAQRVKDVAAEGHLSTDELDRLCRALATLHPPIPIGVLSKMSDLHQGAIRSFAASLGRSLYVHSDTLQFRDEPTETWFRETYRPVGDDLRDFALRFQSLSPGDRYAAFALPQLLFEACAFEDLVQLALSNADLPGDHDDPQRLELARQRARFAFAAMLLQESYDAAALLAVRFGELSAGRTRRLKMYRANPDLCGRFLPLDEIDRLCTRRQLSIDWPGSHVAVEAAMLTERREFRDLSRGRLREAGEIAHARVRLALTENDFESNIDAGVLSDIAMATMNLDGPDASAEMLSGWGPPDIIYEVCGIFLARLAEAGRLDDLYLLLLSSHATPALLLAGGKILFKHGLDPGLEVSRVLAHSLAGFQEPPAYVSDRISRRIDVRGPSWIIALGLRHSVLEPSEAGRLVESYIPPTMDQWAGEWHSNLHHRAQLLGHAIRAHLSGRALELSDVASVELQEALARSYSSSGAVDRYRANILALIPWIQAWVDTLIGGGDHTFQDLIENQLPQVSDYNTPYVLINTVAEVCASLLSIRPDADLRDRFSVWYRDHDALLGQSRIPVIRLCGRSPELSELAVAIASQGVEALLLDRTESESRIDGLILIARAVLSLSPHDAKAIFDTATSEADQVGDDLFSRWSALLAVAGMVEPGVEVRRSYRLLQIAEQLDRDTSSVDEEELGRLMGRLHPPSLLTSASRVRDRRTLLFRRLLESAVRAPSGDATPAGVARFALLAFDPNVSWREASKDLDPDARDRIARVMNQFVRCDRPPSVEQAFEPRRDWGREHERDPAAVDPLASFRDAPLTSAAAWDAAYAALDWASHSELLKLVAESSGVQRSLTIDAFADATAPGFFDIVTFAGLCASAGRSPAVRSSLTRLARAWAKRFALEICSRQDDRYVDEITASTGVSEQEITETALGVLALRTEDLEYRDCFTISARLARKLPPPGVTDVFDSLSALFDDLAPPETSADGAVSDLALAPPEPGSGIGGFIWAALGDTEMRTRWQAAHAVLLLVELDCSAELEALLKYAVGSSPVDPFVDARFTFYELHARMWLLIALSRAASEESAACLGSFVPWLVDITLNTEHATNQYLAQRTLQSLVDAGHVGNSAEITAAIQRRLLAEWIEVDYNDRDNRVPLEPITTDTAARRFFFEFENYWCDDLARAFATTEADIANRTRVALTLVGGHDASARQNDPRRARGVYEDSSTYVDHGTWPKQDDLDFYYTIHGVLTVGAQLAQHAIASKEPESRLDDYMEWLGRYLPSREDGRWLSDRRDPSPALRFDLDGLGSSDHWPWSIRRTDFEVAVAQDPEWLTVHEYSSVEMVDRSETTTVASSLVRPATAHSLLSAMQTAPHPEYFKIPHYGDHERIELPPFDLLPWLNSRQDYGGLDERDERAGDIRFPPPRPSVPIVDRFDLCHDKDQRAWTCDGLPAFRSLTWSNLYSRSRNREFGQSGSRLQVHRSFLSTLCAELDRSLILRATLQRSQHADESERMIHDHEYYDIHRPSTRIFVIDQEGHWLEH